MKVNRDLVFRETLLSDIEELFSVRARTRESPISKEGLASIGVTPESIAKQLASGQVKGWVCLDSSTLVGFCNGDRETGEVLVLAVLPEYERKGIGACLLSRVVEWLRSVGSDTIWLAASPDTRIRAHGFYRSLGWRPNGKTEQNGDEILVLDHKPMNRDPSLIDALFAKHGVSGPWETLPSTGVANDVYATRDVVLRVATDHRDAVPDARTESVAAPIAYAAGILTPRLIAFDDTRVLVDRPFSLWERVHGLTLGLINPPPIQRAEIWRAVGRELAHLHLRVHECPDPLDWLDHPIRERDLGTLLEQLVKSRRADDHTAQSVERLIRALRPHLMEGVTTQFIHGDVHAMNVMCTPGGELRAILDWGDAGWGDPAMDFGAIPLDEVSSVLEAYEEEAPGALGGFPKARIAWDRLLDIMDDLWASPERASELQALQEFVHARMG